MQRIVIAGGGFGGLYTALALQKFPWQPQVTLIDRAERFVFTPLLYELITQEMEIWEVAPRFQELLTPLGVRFIQGEVSDIDLTTQQVLLSDGLSLPYDQAVIGLGGRTPTEIVPGAPAFALPFRTLAHAVQLIEKLNQWDQERRQDIRIAVVGGGASGVELACKLADRLQERARITLIERQAELLSESSPELRRIAQRELTRRDITIRLQTPVERVEANQLFLKGHQPLTTDVTLWTVGTRAAEVLAGLPVERDGLGRICTRPSLQIGAYPQVFALGDCANTGQPLPITAQVAFQQADLCAWNLWANDQKLPLLDFHYLDLGQLISLGINNAAAQLMGFTLDGPAAAQLRRGVYLARLPNLNHQIQVGCNWLAQPLKNALLTQT